MAPRGRGRGRRGRGRRRLAPEQRHALAVTYTRYVPPLNPPPRELAAQWRRVLQDTLNLAQDSTNAWLCYVDVLPSALSSSTSTTSGFDAFFLHRVTVWSGVVVPASGQTVWPTIRVHMCDATGQQLWPSYIDHTGGYNRRARIGLHVPSHLSGPFLLNGTKRFMRVETYQESSVGEGNFPIKTCVVEWDVTLV